VILTKRYNAEKYNHNQIMEDIKMKFGFKKWFFVVTIFAITILLASSLIPGQEKEKKKATARDLFYTGPAIQPTPTAAKPPVAPIGINYKIVKSTVSPPGICDFMLVSPAATFQTGDMIKLLATANVDGHLYIINQGTSGAGKVLFPSPQINQGKNFIKRGIEYFVPATGWWKFTPPAGTEKMILYFSKAKINPLETNIPQGQVPENIIIQLQKGAQRDLIHTEQANSPQVSVEGVAFSPVQSTFVVHTNPQPDSYVIAEIFLTHK
jgi:hypothetical protein